MKAQTMYEKYEKWDELAAQQDWHWDWEDDVFIGIGLYLNECIQSSKSPTFTGFFKFLERNYSVPVED